MTSIAVIACSNGLGHVRRALLLGEALCHAGVAVTLFAPAASVARISQTLGRDFDGVKNIDFDTGTSAAALRSGDPYALRWADRLPPLDSFDLVVSDNLPEILERRPDAVLSGSFLWHLDLKDASPELFDNAEALLRCHYPSMLTSALFATPGLKGRVQPHYLDVYAAFERPAALGENLLISCGHGGHHVEGLFAQVVEGLLQKGPGGFGCVYVEPRLMSAAPPAWMMPARFDSALYGNLKAAICRPGMGTISDALVARARIFSLYEAGNLELEFNASRLNEMGVGQTAANAGSAVEMAWAFSRAADAQARHWMASEAVRSDGGEQAAEILLAQIGRRTK